MKKEIEITIILPAYNEEENLVPLVEKISEVMKGAHQTYEVIIVDDASTDNTRDVAQAIRKKNPEVRMISHVENQGQSAGQATGFEGAKGKIIVTMDADGQNDPVDIPRLLHSLTDDIDCVTGVRRVRRDNVVRRISSKIANQFRNIITGDRITDAGCTYRAIRKSALNEVPVFNGMHRFLPTLLRVQGFGVKEIKVNHRPRLRGESKYGISNRLWRGIRDCFAMRWYTARSIKGNRTVDEK